MKLRLYCLIFILSSTFVLKSQKNHNGLMFQRTVSSFGEVKYWVSRVDSFSFTNTSNKTIYILKQLVPRNFELKTPSFGILPGESSYIEVIYTPRVKGKFREKLKMFHSGSDQPFFFEFKGEVKSFDPYAQIACPSFSNPNVKKLNFDIEIKVIDSLSKQPLEGVLTELNIGEKYQQLYTNKKGVITKKSELGLFFIYTKFEGYYSKNIECYFNPKRRFVTITLVPVKNEVKTLSKIDVDVLSPNLRDDYPQKIVSPDFSYTPSLKIPIEEENPKFSISKFEQNNIVFLIDVSASMRGKDRLELLKESMIQLTYMLRSIDKVTIITYSDQSEVVMSSTSGENKQDIIKVINQLKAGGTTFGGKAIRKAYKVLKTEYLLSGNNQILLATDGGFNGLGKNENKLQSFVKNKASSEMFFSVLAFGKNIRGKKLIEELSISGKGNYLYIETSDQAKTKVNQMIMEQSVKN